MRCDVREGDDWGEDEGEVRVNVKVIGGVLSRNFTNGLALPWALYRRVGGVGEEGVRAKRLCNFDSEF